MSARAGALAIGLLIVGLGALLFVPSVNREIAAIHRRLDTHERFIGVLAELLPVVSPLPREERPPAP